jgi:beta-galactosidase
MTTKLENMKKRTQFNFDWKFVIGDDVEMRKGNFDDSEWRTLDLPHDWGIEGPFKQEYASGTAYLQGGIGWYRKTFEIPLNLKDKKVHIQFDGVYKNSEVWINEHYLGKRPYGYSSFHYDLTPYLNFGYEEKNVIAVRVDHPDIADSRWYAGSGIYRNVFLHISDHIYIKPYGIFVSTPVITASKAQIRMETTLVNENSEPVEINLIQIITNDQGHVITKKQSTIIVPEKSEQTYSQEAVVDNPMLWSIELPYLYNVETQVIRNGEVADQDRTTLGIRYFHFDPDKGFFLNGTHLKMKGVCVHHDAGCLGAAVPVKVWERRLTIFKEAGVNAIRMSHNPPAPELLDLCDSMGFLVMDEAFDEWEFPKNKWVEGHNKGIPSLDGYAANFDEWADIDLRDMILRDRNHPSIVFWSIGNEIDYPNDPYSHAVLGGKYDPNRPNAERMGDIAQRLVKVVKQYDTTRPVTAALASPLMSNETLFPDSLDVVGYNYMEHLYDGDHIKYPKRVIYGSENGRNQQAWTAVENNEYMSAQFIWTGIDYLGEARGWPIRNSTSGMMDLAGFKKPLFYFKQSVWSEVDMVHLGIIPVDNKPVNGRVRKVK